MRTMSLMSGVALVLAWELNVQAGPVPYDTTIALPQVEVRSGPSSDPKMYPTGKLRQGDRVRVVREEAGGWLAIEPPTGSFSWINTRFLEISSQQNTAQVLGDDVPVRVGSELTKEAPTVQQIKLQRGAQVIVLDQKKAYTEDGGWLPIVPPPQEVRYIPAEAVRVSPQVQTVQSSPGGSAQSGADGGIPAGVTGVGVDPLWQQAQQAAQAGKLSEAERLYLQLARQTTDHDLSMRCYNRINFLRQGGQAAATPVYQPVHPNDPYYTSQQTNARLVPTPVNSAVSSSIQAGQPTSQYTYRRDVPVAPMSQTQQAAPAAQASGPGWLRRAPFWLDQKATYVLESSQGMPRMYVTAQPGVNLESYVNRTVDLWGTVVYRGDVKTNYMSVLQVRPLQTAGTGQ